MQVTINTNLTRYSYTCTWRHFLCDVQWTYVTMTAFVPKDIAIKINLLLYRILNEQIDM